MTLILARELRGRDITVNTVAPGPTATDLYLDGKDQETIDRAAQAPPLQRLGTPEDVAERRRVPRRPRRPLGQRPGPARQRRRDLGVLSGRPTGGGEMVRLFVATTVALALWATGAAAQAPPPTPAADPVITAPIGSPLKAGALAAADDFPTPRTFPDMPLHDPYILADETTRTYYLYTQNVASLSGSSGGGTMVYRSKNLVNWSDPAKVYAIETDGWARQQNGAWAPEVHTTTAATTCSPRSTTPSR